MNKYARYSLIATAVIAMSACSKQEQPATGSQPASAPSQAAAGGETVVKIGQVSPMSGPISHLGKDNEYGAKLAIEDLNAKGVEIGGKKVKFELVSEDDQGDPKIGTQVAQRLVDAGVVGVVGHLNSGTTIPASKIYSDAGLPQISPSATNPDYTKQGFKTTFRVIANDVQQGKALGEFAAGTLNAKKIAIIDDRTAYGQGLADQFEGAVKSKGAQVVKREFTNNTATDFNAILTSIKASNPDLVFYGGMDAQAGPLAKQMQRLGLKAKLMGGDGWQTPEFVKLAGDASEGQYASSCGISRDKMPGFKAFDEKFKKEFNTDVQIYAPFEYDAVMVLVDAMKRAKSYDPKAYLPEVGKTDYLGVTGKIAFDDKGDIKNGAVTVYQVKNGKWEVVSTVGGEAK
ncbi:branched-chain amino acid ABC transporter substrate-binding protein [Chromobacterium vaccinii]|uniref:Branched chain amino acid ABC transporter substrate-binding protein n=1 Tax=Chromobacterium vaccinii TaxID=1108595 RepID=A0A1D9LCX1_9NEIS|nr:branched-chain amino acid ABC transporter substrate-binding protein [Chromobacterium vaccinii]AOZ49091.1 branched chain amino acid ABC transporter substrate-binding protein [Chromobacterium vaccinii]QND85104.1 Branched chain amino acid ABC transporter substrate-binding protein [Chromobacterium vaccinii]QND90335.1 Branched chain amino acid ABC transporter substrate-binding protein [Chromobacterium vaccinii]SUX55316.1 Leucine-, isoleucine-, valine-, threonine-, and alanine-binding protein prec